MTLRSKLIRLASAQPALRPHLLPLLKTGESLTTLIDEMTVWMEDSLDEGTISKATFEYVGNMVDDAKRGKTTAYTIRIEWEDIKDNIAGGSTRSYMWEYEGPDDGSIRDIIEDVAGDLGVEFSISSDGTSSGGRSWMVSLKTNDEQDMMDFQRAMDRKGFHGYRRGYRRGYRGASTKKASLPKSVFDMNRVLSKETLPDGEDLLSTFQDAKVGQLWSHEDHDLMHWVWVWPNGDWADIQPDGDHYKVTPGRGAPPTRKTASTKKAWIDPDDPWASDDPEHEDSPEEAVDRWNKVIQLAQKNGKFTHAELSVGMRLVQQLEAQVRGGRYTSSDTKALTSWFVKSDANATRRRDQQRRRLRDEEDSYPSDDRDDTPSLQETMPWHYTER